MKSRLSALIAILALASASPAFAADPEKPGHPEPGPEARQKMAAAHQKMADCLKSDRPMSECKAEMKKSCHEMKEKGEGGCSMMGTGGGMGHGTGGAMKHGQPAKEQPKEQPKE